MYMIFYSTQFSYEETIKYSGIFPKFFPGEIPQTFSFCEAPKR